MIDVKEIAARVARKTEDKGWSLKLRLLPKSKTTVQDRAYRRFLFTGLLVNAMTKAGLSANSFDSTEEEFLFKTFEDINKAMNNPTLEKHYLDSENRTERICLVDRFPGMVVKVLATDQEWEELKERDLQLTGENHSEYALSLLRSTLFKY